jgi:hypothetical protein
MSNVFRAVFVTMGILLSELAHAQLPQPVNIPIQNIPQETNVWCWAAVAQQIILASRGPVNTPPQCALVAMANGAPPIACCGGYNPNCLVTGSIPQIQNLILQFGGHVSSYAPPTDPMTLYRTLSSGHPVILQIASGPGSAHVVVVTGMSFVQTPFGIDPVLHVNDPMAIFAQPISYGRILPIWMSAIVVN